MSYLGELRGNLRPLGGASLGSGVGLMLMSYTSPIFGPYLVRQFGWSKSQYALIGLAMVSTLIALPFIGKLTDRVGVRRSAAIGVVGIPACLFAYSMMSGSFAIYFVIACLLLLFGMFTSPVVYTRLIAADFRRARGLALTCVTIAPAALGSIGAPLLTRVIEAWGWRDGYRALGAVVLVFGLVALALVPPADPAARPEPRRAPTRSRSDFSLILRSGPFWTIFAAMLACSLPTPIYASQMALMLADHRLRPEGVAAAISLFGLGTIIGRLLCGLALDRFPAPLVAAVSMAPPAIGFALLALSLGGTTATMISMFLVGVAVGSEGDLQSFLVARHFALGIFSTTLGLVYCAVLGASAIGATLLSISLKATGSFTPFLAGVSASVAIGGLLFLLLPRDGSFALIGGGTDRDDSEPRPVPPLAEATPA